MVEIHSNTTVLPDEFIAHRLGMVPLVSANCDEGIRYTRVRILLQVGFIMLMLVKDCTCLSGCKYCAIELRLDVACNDNHTMEVTSNHLEVVEFTADPGSTEGVQEGDEIAKRGEGFGNPVGKSTVVTHIKFMNNNDRVFIDDPSVPPVLICKMRKGQELRLRCVAKKVSRFQTTIVYIT